MQPSRLTAGCHHPAPPRTGNHPCRAEARWAIAPETRKQIDPRQSGRQTSLLYSGLVKAVCIAWYVVTLKNSVPADWTIAAHHPAVPPGERRPDQASQLWRPPPAVNKIEPTKKVMPSAESPTSCT